MAIRFPVGRQQMRGAVKFHSGSTATMAVREQVANIQKNLEQVINSIEGATEGAIEFALQAVMDTSQELVPVDTGALKASGFIQVFRMRSTIQGVAGYAAGGSPFYAALVHENLEFYHIPPTQAKFLEEAVNRHEKNFRSMIIDFMLDETGA